MKYLILILAFVIANSISIQSQSKYLSGGIELGMIQNWTKMTKDETGVFINNQNLGYNIYENYKRIFLKYHTPKYNFKLDYSRAIYTDYLCTEDNFVAPFKGKECGGSDWNVNQININIGKEFKIFKWLHTQPSLGIGYVNFGDIEVGYFGESGSWGSGFIWSYSSLSTSFRNDNFNINAGCEMIFKLNPILKLKLMYAYQQALFKIYRSDIIAWLPENPDIYMQPTDLSKLKYATVEARGSNTQFGVGLEFVLKTFDK